MANHAIPTRCIYTGDRLVSGDSALSPSREHIIPLALGGSHDLTTLDVSTSANSRAGNEIDDAFISQFPVLGLRHRFGLKGNRKSIPNVELTGEFIELGRARATMEISPDAEVAFRFTNEQQVESSPATVGRVITLNSTVDRVRFLLERRLEQAQKRSMSLFTPYGQIQDAEDIEIALLLAPQAEGKTFKASLKIDLRSFHRSHARLVTKIALGLGHRVLGPSWTFGPGGDLLRRGLWDDSVAAQIHGSIAPLGAKKIPGLNVSAGTHSFAIMPVGERTAALIALFGGELGVAMIDLGTDTRQFFLEGLDAERGGCSFVIPLASEASQRRMRARTCSEVANETAP